MIRRCALLIVTITALAFVSGYSQNLNSIIGSPIDIDQAELPILENTISKYSLYEINIKKKDINPSKNSGIITMDLGNIEYRMRLYSNNLKISESIENPPHLLGGIHTENGAVSLTINDDFIYGFIRDAKEEIYIEPLWYFESDQAKNIYVVYNTNDVIKTSEHVCGVEDTNAQTPEIPEKSNSSCRTVDYAIANTFDMFTKYNTITGVTNHNLAVLNNVQTNYLCVFNSDLEYNVVTHFIPTTSPDPFTTSTDASTLLADFRVWAGGWSAGGGGAAGITGGFGMRFDMAGIWTDRNFAGSTIGIAYVGHWFHALEDFTNNAAFLNTVQTHEMGHNWGYGHDASGSPFIMAPAVQNTSSWSTPSINTINTRLNSLSSTVLPDCTNRYIDNDNDGFGSSTIASIGGVTNDTDCNDNNATIFPGAPELCDGLINDCNTTTLNSNEIDNDNDGYVECSIDPGGWRTTPTKLGDDCNDAEVSAFPGAPELCDGIINNCNTTTLPPNEMDNDNDGFVPCIIDLRGWKSFPIKQGEDCDDNNSNSFPGGIEICDFSDNNCDGRIDEGFNTSTYFLDNDGDGFGTSNATIDACATPPGYANNPRDCDDNNSTVFPGAPELCDGILNDCDGTLPTTEIDNDNDGFVECTIDPGGWRTTPIKLGDDCDDNNNTVYPGAPELCDQIDNNCNMQVDEGANATYYVDSDGDGFGDPNNSVMTCNPQANEVSDNTDCDDSDNTVFPGATELCDGKLNNCNGSMLPTELDSDGDGYVECTISTGSNPVKQGDDCDDNDGTVYPTAPELCDGQINDCNTSTLPSNEADNDNDGYIECTLDIGGWDGGNPSKLGNDCDDNNNTVYPGAPELCDELDNNCDTNIDDGLVMDYYNDNDGDGFGAGSVIVTCSPSNSQVLNDNDCDDNDDTVFPGATELCDGKLNNCNGNMLSTELDADSDGYVECTISTGSNPVKLGDDCNDSDGTVYPTAPELCDGQINNCNTSTLPLIEVDNDNDGYVECTIDAGGWDGGNPTKLGDDCNDIIFNVNPGATEICNDNLDNNCDGIVDYGCFDCDAINLVINNGNIMAVNRAQQTIDSDALVNLNSVLYTAGNNIELMAPFEVASGKVFEARIEPCTVNAQNEEEPDNARNNVGNQDVLNSVKETFTTHEVVLISVTDFNNNEVIILNGKHSEIYNQFLDKLTTLESGKYTLTIKGETNSIEKNMMITQQ